MVIKRSYLQTRSVLRVQLPTAGLADSDSIELFNDTSGSSVAKAPLKSLSLTTQSLLAEGANLESSLLASSVELRLSPSDPSLSQKFSYGDNQLRLLRGDSEPKGGTSLKINLRDFSFFGLATSSFATSGQKQGGFQGRVGLVASPILSNGQGELTTGFIGMINH